MKIRSEILKALRQHKEAQYEYQRGLCCWCLQPMLPISTFERDKSKNRYPTWEHIRKRAEGGTNDLANLVLAHRACNCERTPQMAEPHFRSYTEPNQ